MYWRDSRARPRCFPDVLAEFWNVAEILPPSADGFQTFRRTNHLRPCDANVCQRVGIYEGCCLPEDADTRVNQEGCQLLQTHIVMAPHTQGCFARSAPFRMCSGCAGRRCSVRFRDNLTEETKKRHAGHKPRDNFTSCHPSNIIDNINCFILLNYYMLSGKKPLQGIQTWPEMQVSGRFGDQSLLMFAATLTPSRSLPDSLVVPHFLTKAPEKASSPKARNSKPY